MPERTDPSSPSPPRRRARRLPGRRRRSLRYAAAILGALVAVGAVAGVIVYRLTRPEVRRPGEELPDITRKLAKDLPEDAPMPRFTDVTEEAGLAEFESFRGDRTSQLPEDMGPGAAWGDYDGDGDDDLFLVSAGGTLGLPPEERAPSRLYENLGDGTFRPAEGFPNLRIFGMAAAWGDYDGDGREDLAVSGYQTLALFHNEGGGSFSPDPALPDLPGYWAGVAWADFDLDGDLDLYICGYVRYVEPEGERLRTTQQYGAAVPYTLNPASFEPERNLLFRNDGGRFTEVAAGWGVSNPSGRSLGALWHDFDADGRPDLYVANDISDNALLMNRGETFEDVSLAALVADYRGAMGLAAGDWNRDGDDDLFVTHWVAQENALYDSRLADLARAAAEAGPGEATPPARLVFTDLAAPLGLGQIALPVVGWGTELADFDGDGWLDVAVVNGSTFETGETPKTLEPQAAFLLWSQHGEHFHDLAPLSEPLAVPRVGRGLALSDYDGDGDLDLLVTYLGDAGKRGGVRLLRNDMPQSGWIELSLRHRTAPSGEPRGSGEGAVLIARVGEVELRRTVGGASYLSQRSRVVHLGLGEADAVDRLEVRWPGGEVQVFEGLAAGFRWRLVEGEPEPVRLSSAPAAQTAAGSTAPRSSSQSTEPLDERQRVVAFWEAQRAGMDAIKRDDDCPRAVGFFRRALELDPSHGDARYYLANCLAEGGDVEAALAELTTMLEYDPRSHRGLKQWGTLKAMSATTRPELEEARASLERALEVNQEETGTLLMLGEIALLEGQPDLAEQRFEWACRTNPKAVGGFYLRGYVAWKQGDEAAATELLAQAHAARGEDWVPEGAVAEGDVKKRQHREVTPLSRFWEAWDGTPDPATAFAALDAHLRSSLGPPFG